MATGWRMGHAPDGQNFVLIRPGGVPVAAAVSVTLDDATVRLLAPLGETAGPYLDFLADFQNRRLSVEEFLARATELFIDDPAFKASLADALRRGGKAGPAGIALRGLADGAAVPPEFMAEISDALTDTSPLAGEEVRAILTEVFRDVYRAVTEDGVPLAEALLPVRLLLLLAAGDEASREELARLFGELVFDLVGGTVADAVRLAGDALVFWRALGAGGRAGGTAAGVSDVLDVVALSQRSAATRPSIRAAIWSNT